MLRCSRRNRRAAWTRCLRTRFIAAPRGVTQTGSAKTKDTEAPAKCSFALRTQPRVGNPGPAPGRRRVVRRHRHTPLRQRAIVPVVYRGRSRVPLAPRPAAYLAAHAHTGRNGRPRRGISAPTYASFAAQARAVAGTSRAARLDRNSHRPRNGSIRRIHEPVFSSGSRIHRRHPEPDGRPRHLQPAKPCPKGRRPPRAADATSPAVTPGSDSGSRCAFALHLHSHRSFAGTPGPTRASPGRHEA